MVCTSVAACSVDTSTSNANASAKSKVKGATVGSSVVPRDEVVDLEAVRAALALASADGSAQLFDGAVMVLRVDSSCLDHPLLDSAGDATHLVAVGKVDTTKHFETPPVVAQSVTRVLVGTTITADRVALASSSSSFAAAAKHSFITKQVDLNHLPLPMDTGRYLMSLVSQLQRNGATPPNVESVWARVHSALAQDHTKYIGVSARGSGLLLAPPTPLFSEKDYPTMVERGERLPTLGSLLQSYVDAHNGANGRYDGDSLTADQVRIQVHAKYELMTSDDTSNSLPSMVTIESLSDECHEGILSAPPTSATLLVRVRSVQDDEKAPAKQLRRELDWFSFLNSFDVSAVDLNEPWQKGLLGGQMPIVDAIQEAGEFIATVRIDCGMADAEDPRSAQTETADVGDTNPVSSTGSVLAARADLDFTERLWMLCMRSKSLKQMQTLVKHVLAALVDGRLLPMVHKNNHSVLAELARQSIALFKSTSANRQEAVSDIRRAIAHWLEDGHLLEMICQCGAEKLRRDCVQWLTAEGATTYAQFQSFVTDSVSLNQQITSLQILQKIIHVMCLAKMYANAPRDSLRSIVGAALQFYQNANADTTTPEFWLNVPAFSADAAVFRRACRMSRPSQWKVTMMPLQHSESYGAMTHSYSFSARAEEGGDEDFGDTEPFFATYGVWVA